MFRVGIFLFGDKYDKPQNAPCRISLSLNFAALEYARTFSHTFLYNSTLYYVHLSRACRVALNIFAEFFLVERKIVRRETEIEWFVRD